MTRIYQFKRVSFDVYTASHYYLLPNETVSEIRKEAGITTDKCIMTVMDEQRSRKKMYLQHTSHRYLDARAREIIRQQWIRLKVNVDNYH